MMRLVGVYVLSLTSLIFWQEFPPLTSLHVIKIVARKTVSLIAYPSAACLILGMPDYMNYILL